MVIVRVISNAMTGMLIHYRFDVAVTTAVADSMKYDKKRKAA